MEIIINIFQKLATATFLIYCTMGLPAAFAADSTEVTGVVTNVNSAKQSITISNTRTKVRRTYFLANDTRIRSDKGNINLSDIKRGNTVSLRYRNTDLGREIVFLELPDADEVVDIIPVDFTTEQLLEGTITGVRRNARTLTVRDRETRMRLTLKVPETARIRSEGKDIVLRDLRSGDEIIARYLVTDRGLILVSGRTPSPNSTAAGNVAMLPTTAGTGFYWLLIALISMVGALCLYQLRREQL